MSALIAVSKPQAHPVLELVLDIIEQATEVAAVIAHHRELLCRCGGHSETASSSSAGVRGHEL